MKHAVNIAGDLSDDGKTITLEHPIKDISAGKVKLVVIQDDEEVSEEEWLSAIAKSDLYDDLKHPEEDIYTVNDGKPYYEFNERPLDQRNTLRSGSRRKHPARETPGLCEMIFLQKDI
ncbi:MAG: hypothetical protein OEV66_06555 [Spirochaetia bacterium]|nr:hypothetical protein [Spirochaetia bacterium]